MAPGSNGSSSTDPGEVGGSDRRALAAYLARKTAVVGVVVALWWVSRPLWHGVVYSMLFSPPAAVLFGGGLVAALVLWYLPPSRVEDTEVTVSGTGRSRSRGPPDSPAEMLAEVGWTGGRKLRVFLSVVGVLFVLALLVSVPTGALEQRTLAERTMADATEVAEFPQANPDNPRVVPREVSDVSTRGSVSYRQHRLGASDIARQEDGSLAWSYPIEPDGFRNEVVENQRGVLVADMTQLDERPTRAVETEFRYGQGMFLHRSADWNLKATDYVTRYDDDAVEFVHDGRPYMYYAKTGHEWELAPLPHTVPVWDGGALVHPNGTIDHLSPAQAREHPVLEGQRLYPLTLTRAEMGALGYRNGIVNQLPVVGAHEGEIEVARLPPATDNRQPFVIDLQGERLSYVTAMEPYGEDTRGLDEVWFADAETGAYTYFATGEETLTGPERAMGIARSADSRTNWGEDFVVEEPVPVTVEGDLWWQVKVAPTDFTDVARNVFVNTDTGDTLELRTDDAVRSFVAGEDVLNRSTESSTDADRGRDSGGEDGVLYVVVITDEDGNVVYRRPVESGQEARIEPAGNRTAGASTAS